MIKKNRINKLIEQFEPKELKKLRKFVTSPFFNQQKKLVTLLDYYISEKGNPPNKVSAYKALLPNKTFNEQDLRLHNSYLYKLVEKYIAYQEIEQDQFLVKQKTAEGFKRRNLTEFALRALKKARDFQEAAPLRNAAYYDYAFQNNAIQYYYDADSKPTEKVNATTFQALDIAFFIQQLSLACTLLSHQTTYSSAYDFSFLKIILREIEAKNLLDIPAIATYYYCYLLLSQPNNIQHFEHFKQLLIKNSLLFDETEIKNLYLAAINFCIKKINEGDELFFQQALDLYKAGLKNEALLENNILSRFTYHNIVMAGIRTKEFKWVEQFIHQYRKSMKKRYQESAFHFSMANLLYYRKDFEGVLSLLQKSNYRDVLLNLGAKTLLLKVYYELEEFDLLYAHLEAMKNFIRRKRVIGYHKTNYLNVVRFTQKLLQLNFYDKIAIQDLHQTIEKVPVLTEKKWLLMQLLDGK